VKGQGGCDHESENDATWVAAIVATSFDAIISKDLDGIVRSWNPAAERIFGWTAADMVGQSIRKLIPEDRQEEEDSILSRISAGELIPKFETVRRHRAGHAIPVAVTVSPLRSSNGTIVGASKIAHDISEMIDLRTQLQESEFQFRTLANNIPQLAWIADGDGSIFWYNDRWFEYTGTTLEQMSGWGWVAVHHPDYVDKVRERIQHSWDTGDVWEDTFPLRSRDGQYRWFLSRAVPVRRDDGSIRCWFGTNTDVTLQREQAQQIQTLMGEVGHRAKNMLAVIQAMVSRTADRSYSEAFARRLQALARNQDLLTKRSWTGVTVGELILSQLAVVSDLLGSRISLAGDLDIVLSPSAAETIGLAIHELATNATKYGALSGSQGRVFVRSRALRAESLPVLQLCWEEVEGPIVLPPQHRGFGAVMIDQNPRATLGANVELDYPITGFRWQMTAPIERVTSV